MSNVNTYSHKTNWTCQTYDTGASAWISATKWPAASINPFSRRYTKTSNMINLADGSLGMFTPSTHYNLDPITLMWHPRSITNTFRTNLKTYKKDHTGIKLTLHDDAIIEGYIMMVDEQFPLSGETQTYALTAEIQPFDVDNDGTISE